MKPQERFTLILLLSAATTILLLSQSPVNNSWGEHFLQASAQGPPPYNDSYMNKTLPCFCGEHSLCNYCVNDTDGFTGQCLPNATGSSFCICTNYVAMTCPGKSCDGARLLVDEVCNTFEEDMCSTTDTYCADTCEGKNATEGFCDDSGSEPSCNTRFKEECLFECTGAKTYRSRQCAINANSNSYCEDVTTGICQDKCEGKKVMEGFCNSTAEECQWREVKTCRDRYCDSDLLVEEVCLTKPNPQLPEETMAYCDLNLLEDCYDETCCGTDVCQGYCNETPPPDFPGDGGPACMEKVIDDCDETLRCRSADIVNWQCKTRFGTPACRLHLIEDCGPEKWCEGGSPPEINPGGTLFKKDCFDIVDPQFGFQISAECRITPLLTCDPLKCEFCTVMGCGTGYTVGCGWDAGLGWGHPNLCQICIPANPQWNWGGGCVNQVSCSFPDLPNGDQCAGQWPLQFLQEECIFDWENCQEPPPCGRARCVSEPFWNPTRDDIWVCGTLVAQIMRSCGYSHRSSIACQNESEEAEQENEQDIEDEDNVDDGEAEELDLDLDSGQTPDDSEGEDIEVDVPDADSDPDVEGDGTPDSESEADDASDVDIEPEATPEEESDGEIEDAGEDNDVDQEIDDPEMEDDIQVDGDYTPKPDQDAEGDEGIPEADDGDLDLPDSDGTPEEEETTTSTSTTSSTTSSTSSSTTSTTSTTSLTATTTEPGSGTTSVPTTTSISSTTTTSTSSTSTTSTTTYICPKYCIESELIDDHPNGICCEDSPGQPARCCGPYTKVDGQGISTSGQSVCCTPGKFTSCCSLGYNIVATGTYVQWNACCQGTCCPMDTWPDVYKQPNYYPNLDPDDYPGLTYCWHEETCPPVTTLPEAEEEEELEELDPQDSPDTADSDTPEEEDDVCQHSCWAECVDDLDTDGYCFIRTVMPGYCSSGTCCESNPVPCGDPEPPPDSDTPEEDEEEADEEEEDEEDIGEPDPPEGDTPEEEDICLFSCWAECIDDLNTDGYCFTRTVMPGYCSSGICCMSNPVPCGDEEPRGDYDPDGTPEEEIEEEQEDEEEREDGDEEEDEEEREDEEFDLPDLDDILPDGTPDGDTEQDGGDGDEETGDDEEYTCDCNILCNTGLGNTCGMRCTSDSDCNAGCTVCDNGTCVGASGWDVSYCGNNCNYSYECNGICGECMNGECMAFTGGGFDDYCYNPWDIFGNFMQACESTEDISLGPNCCGEVDISGVGLKSKNCCCRKTDEEAEDADEGEDAGEDDEGPDPPDLGDTPEEDEDAEEDEEDDAEEDEEDEFCNCLDLCGPGYGNTCGAPCASNADCDAGCTVCVGASCVGAVGDDVSYCGNSCVTSSDCNGKCSSCHLGQCMANTPGGSPYCHNPYNSTGNFVQACATLSDTSMGLTCCGDVQVLPGIFKPLSCCCTADIEPPEPDIPEDYETPEEDRDDDGDPDPPETDETCAYSCWAQCIDDINTDGYCFDRTVMPGYCSAGICCQSTPIPCGDTDPPLDSDTPEADDTDPSDPDPPDGDTPEADDACAFSCWAECIDDFDTDNFCFDRTIMPGYCPVGICCKSEWIPCPDGDFEVDTEWTPDNDDVIDDDWDDPATPGDGDPDDPPEPDIPDDYETPEGGGDPDQPDTETPDMPDLDDIQTTTIRRDTCREYEFNKSWGSLGSGESEFNYPTGIAVSPDGEVYVSDYGNDRIEKFMRNGTYLGQLVFTGLIDPTGIFFNPDGTYFLIATATVGGSPRNAVHEFSAEDEYMGIIIDMTNPFDAPSDVAEKDGKTYITDAGAGKVFIFADTGSLWSYVRSFTITAPGDTLSPIPQGIGVDSNGYLYVSDSANNKIKKYTDTGTLIDSWGGEGSSEGLFSAPLDVFVDAFDYVYVADRGNARIQKFDSDGDFITSFGQTGSGPGRFNGPTSVYEDGYGNAYVSDSGNHRIQLWACSHSLCSVYDMALDVGNDSTPPWEWQIYDTEYVKDRVWADPTQVSGKINNILRKGCLSSACRDCTILGEDCLIPFSYKSINPTVPALIEIGGKLKVEDINFSYWIISTIAEVPYSSRLRFSEGGNWTIQYDECPLGLNATLNPNATYLVPPDADCHDLCFDINYVPDSPPTGLDAHDAIDDAMYRLISQKLDISPKDGSIEKLDVDHDGTPETCFDPEHMWFDATDRLGIQSLWGPENAKLIVWEG